MELILDRREGDFAVFESSGGKMLIYPAELLPEGSSDGDVFNAAPYPWEGSVELIPDPSAKAERETSVLRLFEKIKNKG